MTHLRRALIALLFACTPAIGQQAPPPAASPAQPADVPPNNIGESTVADGPTANAAKSTPALDLTPDASGLLSQAQMQQLFREVGEKGLENDKRQRDYTYIERQVENKIDGNGKTKSSEVRTYEVLEIYGDQVERLIEKDDKPLSEKDAAKEEQKIQKVIDKRKDESEGERRKREDRAEKDRENNRKFVTEVANAYNFKLIGSEHIGAREAWVIDGEPRPGFVPHMKEAKFLSRFHGRVWIDKADLQLAKMDVECLDTISFGLFLARFHKGSRLMLEQTRVNDEVWLPAHLTAKIDVRVALLKNFDVGLEQTFRDYKQFRTSSKILPGEEVQEQK